MCGLSVLVLYSALNGFSLGNYGFPLSSQTHISFEFISIWLVNEEPLYRDVNKKSIIMLLAPTDRIDWYLPIDDFASVCSSVP